MSLRSVIKKTIFAAALILIVLVTTIFSIGAVGVSKKAQAATSCRTVSVPEIRASARASQDQQGGSPGDSEDQSGDIDFSPYLNSSEYPVSISYDAGVSANGGTGADAVAEGNAGGVSINNTNSSDTGSFSENLASSTTSYHFNVAARINLGQWQRNDDSSHRGGANAGISNIKLKVCGESGGGGNNTQPKARPDGSSTRICVQNGAPNAINVLKNDGQGGGSYVDADGDLISITGITSLPPGASAAVIDKDGNNWISLTPGSLGDGQFTYTISDGTDTAATTVYITSRAGCGHVTLRLGGELPEDVKEKTIIHPRYDGSPIGPLALDRAETAGWNVELDTDPQIFVIDSGDITPAPGYRLSDREKTAPDGDPEPSPIIKTSVTPAGDQTGEDTTAELGLSYDTGPSGPDYTDAYNLSCTSSGANVSFTDSTIAPYDYYLKCGGTVSSGTHNSGNSSMGFGYYSGTCTVKIDADQDGSYEYTTDEDLDCPAPTNDSPNASFFSTFLPSQSSGSQHAYEFDASNSNDPDGDNGNLTYSWEVTGVSSTAPGQPQLVYNPRWFGKISTQTFINNRDDTTVTYTIELTVTDEDGATDTQTGSVSVTCDSAYGGACMTKN